MKTLKIIQIVIWSIIAVGMIALLIYFIKGNGSFPSVNFETDSGTVLYSDKFTASDIEELSIDSKNADIELSLSDSDSDEIEVVCTGVQNNKENIKIENKNGVLSIKQESNQRLFFLSFNNSVRFDIKLPGSFKKDLAIENISGDISFNDDFNFGNVDIKEVSGDVTGNTLSTDSFNQSSISGDLKFNTVNAQSYKIGSVSGDLKVNELSGSGIIKSTSGDVLANILQMNGGLNISTVSGDVRLSLDDEISVNLSANSVSGDISCLKLTNLSGTFRHNASGKIGNGPYKDLAISTTSGDINID